MPFDKIMEMNLSDIHSAINERNKWIENTLSSEKNEGSVDIEKLRHWSNEIYALNSARIHMAAGANPEVSIKYNV